MKKKNCSRTSALLLACALALSSVNTAFPADWFKRQAQKVGGAVSGTASKLASSASQGIKKNLGSTIDNVRRLGPAAVVSQLQKQTESLGNKVGYMTTCMLKGECSQAERAAFIGTSVAVLALTAAAVGATLTVAATSKEVEAATQKTSKEVENEKPANIFERLNNKVVSFKQSLASLREGILKKRLTRNQKRALYGTALSIAALVTIAVGAGVLSYVYAEKKKAEREAQATPLPQAESETPAPTQTPAAILGNLKELAQEAKTRIEEKMTPMQEYFAQKVVLDGNNLLQTTASQAKALLKEKTQLAKEAIAAAGEKKEQLAKAAQEKLQKAHALANELKAKIATAGPDFFNKALEQVLHVKLEYIQPTIDKINEYTQRSMRAMEPLFRVRLMGQLTKLTEGINTVMEQVGELSGKWSEALNQLASRATWIKSHVRPEALGGKSSAQIQAEAQVHYPLAAIADKLWNFYPEMMKSVNDFKLAGPGIIVQNYLKLTSTLLEYLAALNQATGTVGKAIISPQLSQALADVRQQLAELGQNIRTATAIKPVLKDVPQSTASALLESLKGATWRVGFKLKDQLMARVNTLNDIYNQRIMPLIDAINHEKDAMMAALYDIPTNIKQSFLKQLELNPQLALAASPVYLARFLGENISKVKGHTTKLTERASEALIATADLIKEIPPTAELVNTALGSEAINAELIGALNAIKGNVENLEGLLKPLDQGLQETLDIVPASGA